MPYIPQSRNTNNARFPTPPQKNIQVNSFPNDLIANGRNLCTVINFVDYLSAANNSVSQIASGLGAIAADAAAGIATLLNIPSIVTGYRQTSINGSIILPIPKKINDATTLTWQEESLLRKATQIPDVGKAIGAAAEAISTTSFMTGMTVNPFLFMFFQRPNFKEFVLQWTLIPYNEKESATIVNIVNACKKASLPTKTFGFLLQYPMIAQIRILPNDIGGNMKFKPCAIISVQVDYTGAGMPSFFKGTNLPTVVNLTLSLKEIELWDSSEISA